MKEDLQEKAQFFAQYLRQEVHYASGGWPIPCEPNVVASDHYLLLKPLSMISDEDAVEVVKICGIHESELVKPDDGGMDLPDKPITRGETAFLKDTIMAHYWHVTNDENGREEDIHSIELVRNGELTLIECYM